MFHLGNKHLTNIQVVQNLDTIDYKRTKHASQKNLSTLIIFELMSRYRMRMSLYRTTSRSSADQPKTYLLLNLNLNSDERRVDPYNYFNSI